MISLAKISRVLVVTALPTIFTIAAMAEDNALMVSYKKAIAALNKNDCQTAITELENVKKLAAEDLKKNPDFADLIETQIKRCREYLSSPSQGVPVHIIGKTGGPEGVFVYDYKKSIQFKPWGADS